MVVTPRTFVPATTNTIQMRALPRYAGKGWFSLIGHGGGSPIGRALSPIAGEIGLVSVPMTFAPDQEARLDWSITIETSLDQVALTGVAQYDSVVIDSYMYPVTAPEVMSYFGYHMVPIVTHYITISSGH